MWVLTRIRCMTIRTPLPDIAMHLVQTPTVAWQGLHRHCAPSKFRLLASRHRKGPVEIGLITAEPIAKPEGRLFGHITTTGIFPGDLSRQPGRQTKHPCVEPWQKSFDDVSPDHPLHWIRQGIFKLTWVVTTHHHQPQFLGTRGFGQPETLNQVHIKLVMVFSPDFFASGNTHLEPARRYPAHHLPHTAHLKGLPQPIPIFATSHGPSTWEHRRQGGQTCAAIGQHGRRRSCGCHLDRNLLARGRGFQFGP